MGRVRAVPRLCELYPGIYLTTEEKARKKLSQGSRRVPVGTMKTEYTEQNTYNKFIQVLLYLSSDLGLINTERSSRSDVE
jgi:hypothetical protein